MCMKGYSHSTLAPPSGGRGRRFKSYHPDQLFFINLASCCLFGRYHELTISPLPDFCRTPLTGKLPASRNPNRYFACLPTCSAREHCLGSADCCCRIACFRELHIRQLRYSSRPYIHSPQDIESALGSCRQGTQQITHGKIAANM